MMGWSWWDMGGSRWDDEVIMVGWYVWPSWGDIISPCPPHYPIMIIPPSRHGCLIQCQRAGWNVIKRLNHIGSPFAIMVGLWGDHASILGSPWWTMIMAGCLGDHGGPWPPYCLAMTTPSPHQDHPTMVTPFSSGGSRDTTWPGNVISHSSAMLHYIHWSTHQWEETGWEEEREGSYVWQPYLTHKDHYVLRFRDTQGNSLEGHSHDIKAHIHEKQYTCFKTVNHALKH